MEKIKDCDLEPNSIIPIEELSRNTEVTSNVFEENSTLEIEEQIRLTNSTPIQEIEYRVFEEISIQEQISDEEQNKLENATIGDATNKETSADRPYTTSDEMPSPFKDVFILPQTKLKDIKKRQLKEFVPSVISGERAKSILGKRKKSEKEKN
ncbi:hypothetical protein QE152_g14252 [Popillia japonica]|uniref:Uncharacterized protein n=1 Tax=Popillia japonica TaxID=7064 RepID=A0AAW1LA50_POPJA